MLAMIVSPPAVTVKRAARSVQSRRREIPPRSGGSPCGSCSIAYLGFWISWATIGPGSDR